eukprot:scaffold1132_cov377-Prasinococcus_capsulatus_cf.AAC.4
MAGSVLVTKERLHVPGQRSLSQWSRGLHGDPVELREQIGVLPLQLAAVSLQLLSRLTKGQYLRARAGRKAKVRQDAVGEAGDVPCCRLGRLRICMMWSEPVEVGAVG